MLAVWRAAEKLCWLRATSLQFLATAFYIVLSRLSIKHKKYITLECNYKYKYLYNYNTCHRECRGEATACLLSLTMLCQVSPGLRFLFPQFFNFMEYIFLFLCIFFILNISLSICICICLARSVEYPHG